MRKPLLNAQAFTQCASLYSMRKPLLNAQAFTQCGTYATNWVAAKRGQGIPGIALLVVIGCYWKWLVKCTAE
jgi:hypothetical protein